MADRVTLKIRCVAVASVAAANDQSKVNSNLVGSEHVASKISKEGEKLEATIDHLAANAVRRHAHGNTLFAGLK